MKKHTNLLRLFGLAGAIFCLGSTAAVAAAPPAEPVDLLAGAKWEYIVNGDAAGQSIVIKANAAARIIVRAEFQVDDPSHFVALELSNRLEINPRSKKQYLNGKKLTGPLKGMRYRTIPAIDPALLVKGTNTLESVITIRNRAQRRAKAKDISLDITMGLLGLRAENLKFQTGPVLGAAGKDFFTVTCRTNLPATVTLTCEPPCSTTQTAQPCPAMSLSSPEGLIHRFKVPNKPMTGYRLSATRNGFTVTVAGKVASPGLVGSAKLRFVAMGDSRTNPTVWAKVAATVVKVKPDLIVFVGDMVTAGKNDWEWDEQCFGVAKELFASIPYYAVIGNHEQSAPLFDEIFYLPTADGRGRNWTQRIGDVLLIGIDGRQDWSADSENVKWLEGKLAAAKDAKFIFLASHYPAWTVSSHGRLREDGRPREKIIRQSQDVIMPLLARYRATAMLAGHDHIYNRSQPPGGVTHIVTGGTGAPLQGQVDDAEKQNPYSRVFAKKRHYCLFEFDGDTCTMQAIDLDGNVIDKLTWQARTAGSSQE